MGGSSHRFSTLSEAGISMRGSSHRFSSLGVRRCGAGYPMGGSSHLHTHTSYDPKSPLRHWFLLGGSRVLCYHLPLLILLLLRLPATGQVEMRRDTAREALNQTSLCLVVKGAKFPRFRTAALLERTAMRL